MHGVGWQVDLCGQARAGWWVGAMQSAWPVGWGIAAGLMLRVHDKPRQNSSL